MITMTRALAWAAATDAGNRNMRAHGRAEWDEEDFNTAAAEFGRLWSDGLRVTIATTLDYTRAGAYGPKGYVVRVFVNGVLNSSRPCMEWEVTNVRNRLNDHWSNIADVVVANAIPPIPGRRQKGDL